MAIETEELIISEVQYKTYLTYQRLKKDLTYLVQRELIVYKNEEKRFKITPRGLQVRDMYAKLDELLIRNPPHKMMNTSEYLVLFP
jgi:predicted transcriptional regulator